MQHQQLIVVRASDYHTYHASLAAYCYARKPEAASWPSVTGLPTPILGPIPAVIGRNGFAPPGEKREGDGRTPTGVYPLVFAFGYDPAHRVHTKMPYRQATAADVWVDDVHSPQYNLWVHGQPNAASFEVMRRSDDAYRYGVVIGYNRHRRPGIGSAIFLHVWPGPNGWTAGCVAVSAEHMVALLGWLDPREHPAIFMGTEAEVGRMLGGGSSSQ